MKGTILRSPGSTIFIASMIGLLLISEGRADEHTAASLSPADIQAAVNAASPGDCVILPAGNFIGFNTTVDIPNGVSLRGQGKTSTILRKTVNSTGIVFRVNSANTKSSYPMEFSGFTLYGNTVENPLDTGLAIYGDDVKEFQIHDAAFRDFGFCGIYIRGWCRGVIYKCDILDNYRSGNGYGIGINMDMSSDTRDGDWIWSQYPANTNPGWGGSEFVFVEDCHFRGNRHHIDTNYGGRYVCRYNTMEGQVSGDYAAFINVHGRTLEATYRGARAIEVYHNTLTIDDHADGIVLQGGDGLIWSNVITGSISGAHGIRVEDSGYTGDGNDYPCSDQMRNTYIWGNTENGQDSDSDEWPKADPGIGNGAPLWLVKNRDFYLAPYSYTPFPYPHPLRQHASSPCVSRGLSHVGARPLPRTGSKAK